MGHILALLTVFAISNNGGSHCKVFVTQNKNEAHLWVWRTNRRYESPDREDIWFQTDKRYSSNLTVRWVKSKQQSDLVVYFVKNRTLAGWRKSHPLRNNLDKTK